MPTIKMILFFSIFSCLSHPALADSKFSSDLEAEKIFNSLKGSGEAVIVEKNLLDPLKEAVEMLASMKDEKERRLDKHVIEEWIDTETYFCAHSGMLTVAERYSDIFPEEGPKIPKALKRELIRGAYAWSDVAYLISEYNCVRKP